MNGRKIAVNSRNNLNISNVGMFTIILSFFTVYIPFLQLPFFPQFGFLPPLMGAILFMFTINGGKIRYSKELFLLCAMLLVILFNNREIARHNYAYLLHFLIILAFYISSDSSTRWIDSTITMMETFVVIYATATILFTFTPSLYVNHVVYIFGSYAANAISQYNSGSMPGLTANVSTNAMYMIIGIGISLTKIINYLSCYKISFGYALKRKCFSKEVLILFMEIIALLLTGKRGPLIFMMLSWIAVYLIWNYKKKVTRWFKLGVAVFGLGVIASVLASMVPSLFRAYYRMIELLDSGNLLLGRQLYYSLAIDSIKTHLFLGIGWGGMQYQIAGATWNNVSYNVHNIYLQLLAETGLVGFTVFMTFMIGNLNSTVRYAIKCVKHDQNINLDVLLLSCFMQVFFMLYGLSGNPLYDIQMLYPYIICVASSKSIRKQKYIAHQE